MHVKDDMRRLVKYPPDTTGIEEAGTIEKITNMDVPYYEQLIDNFVMPGTNNDKKSGTSVIDNFEIIKEIIDTMKNLRPRDYNLQSSKENDEKEFKNFDKYGNKSIEDEEENKKMEQINQWLETMGYKISRCSESKNKLEEEPVIRASSRVRMGTVKGKSPSPRQTSPSGSTKRKPKRPTIFRTVGATLNILKDNIDHHFSIEEFDKKGLAAIKYKPIDLPNFPRDLRKSKVSNKRIPKLVKLPLANTNTDTTAPIGRLVISPTTYFEITNYTSNNLHTNKKRSCPQEKMSPCKKKFLNDCLTVTSLPGTPKSAVKSKPREIIVRLPMTDKEKTEQDEERLLDKFIINVQNLSTGDCNTVIDYRENMDVRNSKGGQKKVESSGVRTQTKGLKQSDRMTKVEERDFRRKSAFAYINNAAQKEKVEENQLMEKALNEDIAMMEDIVRRSKLNISNEESEKETQLSPEKSGNKIRTFLENEICDRKDVIMKEFIRETTFEDILAQRGFLGRPRRIDHRVFLPVPLDPKMLPKREEHHVKPERLKRKPYDYPLRKKGTDSPRPASEGGEKKREVTVIDLHLFPPVKNKGSLKGEKKEASEPNQKRDSVDHVILENRMAGKYNRGFIRSFQRIYSANLI